MLRSDRARDLPSGRMPAANTKIGPMLWCLRPPGVAGGVSPSARSPHKVYESTSVYGRANPCYRVMGSVAWRGSTPAISSQDFAWFRGEAFGFRTTLPVAGADACRFRRRAPSQGDG